MKRLYWENTYLMQHQTEITEIGQDEHGNYLRLKETIFHPQGGGQPSDEGTINGFQVIKLKDMREINEINHYIENAHAFKVGDVVNLEIDEEKRLEFSALHTAGHITGGVLRTQFDYHNQVSANHFPLQAKVEFALDRHIDKDELKKQVDLITQNAEPVTEEYNDAGMRCIKINNLWSEPCSGTHVSDTGQIGGYDIRKLELKKGKLTVGYNAEYRKRGKM